MISKRVGIVLELVSAMCDGQHKAMQHILRTQENHGTVCVKTFISTIHFINYRVIILLVK